MFRKDCTTVIWTFPQTNPFLENSFIKVGIDIAYSKEVRVFVESLTEVGQQQYNEFFDTRLNRSKKRVSDTITKNDFLTPAKSTAKACPKKTSTLKSSSIILFVSLCRGLPNRNDRSAWMLYEKIADVPL